MLNVNTMYVVVRTKGYVRDLGEGMFCSKQGVVIPGYVRGTSGCQLFGECGYGVLLRGSSSDGFHK